MDVKELSLDELWMLFSHDANFSSDTEMPDECWAIAMELKQRNDPEIYQRLLDMVANDVPHRAEWAALTLREYGLDGERHGAETVPVVLARLASTPDDEVDLRQALIKALAWTEQPVAFEAFLEALSDADPDLRLTAAQDASFYFDGESDAFTPDDLRLVDALLTRMFDEDGDVRDWAAFALAQCEDTTPAMIDAFLRVIQEDVDRDADVVEEAAIGLAYRGVTSAIPRCVEIMETTDLEILGSMWFKVAYFFEDGRFLPALDRMRGKDWGDTVDELERAVDACTHGRPHGLDDPGEFSGWVSPAEDAAAASAWEHAQDAAESVTES